MIRRKAVRAASGLVLAAAVLLSAAAWAEGPCSEEMPAVRLPPRPADAPDARRFVHAVAGLDEHARDEAVRAQLLAGNMPSFLHRLVPASWTARRADGVPARVTLCVLADYLAIGSDSDYLRVPMGLGAALEVARAFGMMLPTTRIVDAIYRQSAVRLVPQPLPPDKRMRSTATIVRHEELVQSQRAATGAPPDALTAGHKKDLVLTNRLWAQPDRVAIYGWHLADGSPIQTLSTVHGARYADYSHGVRLVAPLAWIDGVKRPLVEWLADATFAPLFSAEGAMPGVDELQSRSSPAP